MDATPRREQTLLPLRKEARQNVQLLELRMRILQKNRSPRRRMPAKAQRLPEAKLTTTEPRALPIKCPRRRLRTITNSIQHILPLQMPPPQRPLQIQRLPRLRPTNTPYVRVDPPGLGRTVPEGMSKRHRLQPHGVRQRRCRQVRDPHSSEYQQRPTPDRQQTGPERQWRHHITSNLQIRNYHHQRSRNR